LWWWMICGRRRGGWTAVWQTMTRTRNSKSLDTKTRTRHDDPDYDSTMQNWKKRCKGSKVFVGKSANPKFYFGFFVDCRNKNWCNLI
jgi:hypothetical protein